LKVAAAAILAVIAWMSLATGDFRLSARTAIEGTVQRAAIAPFDGFVSSAVARAGDIVSEGQVLATLDTRELELEAARWRAERDQQSLKYQEALGKQDRAQARMLAAQVRQAEAQLSLVENKIVRATLRAPFGGLVVSGDLSQMLSAPVETGKVLFEIAPLDTYRAVLQVDERSYVYVKERQTGELRLSGSVMDTVPIVVTKITPVAAAQDGQNTFRVEAELVGAPAWVRPGMEGVARVSVGEQRLIWIWTRSMVDWARLVLWTWWP
jgi:multidrug efflux pump subunit AcrA (membrane-fusion protein)